MRASRRLRTSARSATGQPAPLCELPAGREPVVAWTARDDRPDVADRIVLHDMVGVVAVDRARRVARHQRDAVAYVEHRAVRRGEDSVLLVGPEYRQVVADDRHVVGVGDRLVADINDDLLALPAYHRRLDRQRAFEARHEPAWISVIPG